ncbi:MAG: hypothetical protein B6D46_13350 [Polyangiaceae bacterium UTPRO1]|jgi:hypothetical protein|nr:hypothetical protein [Myxococcales bacterium]OQY65684.1 MAG: hypothetical protein B6D46_13350 [Polyangiaceae bacterium UTPRO1]
MMMSSLGRHIPRDLDKELARAYDGEIPPPYYFWDIALARRHMPALYRPGEIDVVLPYRSFPSEFVMAPTISIDALDEMLERRARREELSGSN